MLAQIECRDDEPECRQSLMIITDVGKFQENSSRQVRIIAEVRTPTPGLMPNGTATMVVYPK